MSNSNSGGGRRAWETSNTGRRDSSTDQWQETRVEAPEKIDEWQATRVEPIDDEWPATRIQPHQPARGDEWQRSIPSIAEDLHRATEAPDPWAATRAQTALATQLLADENEYLATEKEEIGRQVGANERELFVSCAPAEALQQQFEHVQPTFIAVHDVATTSSRKLLAGIAAASGCAVQKLVIRRQGYGTALATLEYVELPTADERSLRFYTTEADADAASRHALALALLGYSQLGVVLVGELPGHAIAAALKPLHDGIVAGPWLNRNLLLLPLASASTLVTHGLDLGRGTGVTVRTTPQVTRPADAWSYITGTWSRLREQNPLGGRAVPELGAFKPAPYQPKRPPPLATGIAAGDTRPMQDGDHQPIVLTIRPMPAIATPAFAPAQTASVVERYARQVSELNGVVGCCVFDVQSGQAVAHAGANPGAPELAAQGAALVQSMMAASRALGFGHALPEAAISLGAHHLLVRGVPKNPGLALHAVLDKTSANLTLARLQVLRMDALFDEPSQAA